MTRTLIVQDLHEGHRLDYVKALVVFGLRANQAVDLLIARAAAESAEFSAHLDSLTSDVNIHVRDAVTWAEVRAVTKDVCPDRVIFPEADGWIVRLAQGLRGPKFVGALVMRRLPQPRRSKLLSYGVWISKRALIWCARQHRNTSVFDLYAPYEESPRMANRAVDPVHLSIANAADRLPRSVAVTGAVTPRKNLPIIAASLAQLRTPVRLFVAGVIAPNELVLSREAFREITANGGSVTVTDRTLSDSELDELIQRVSCLALVYDNVGPSGLLSKALTAGTAVITTSAMARGITTLRERVVEVHDEREPFPDAFEQAFALTPVARSEAMLSHSRESFAATLFGEP